MDFRKALLPSLETGFIDKGIPSEQSFRPQLLVNDTTKEKKVLSSILSELESLQNPEQDSYCFSVAFITTSGVQSIKQALIDLDKRGIKGKILASQYLNFTHPEALKQLLQFEHIELKIATQGDFHNKGYIFKKGLHYNVIIGSSNLTANALSKNKEWNLKVSAVDSSELVHATLQEFEAAFENAQKVDIEYVEHYRLNYNREKEYRTKISLFKEEGAPSKLVPNKMQELALQNLNSLRQKGNSRGLLISATGTGKTFLSAFDAKQFGAKKLLFVVHRRTIAEKSMQSYKALFGDQVKMGLYSGAEQELNADFIFCTVQTLSKLEHLQKFDKKHFDYIVIDETHRAAAASYNQIISHFEPQFLLGMTATPERTDGGDVFKLFDYHIAYEIRLQEALKEEILCPFHYFGVTEIEVDGQLLKEKADFNLLSSDQRVNHIISTIKKYGSDSGTVRGLVFCSGKEECHFLAAEFNKRHLRSIALTGENKEEERAKAIHLLESTRIPEKIDYIFTVDIFNEGIDIPKVNQVIMLRPTQSAIIFVQQLGRGLRKTEGKDFLTVIDFIGNYSNNFLVPIALFGDSSYNKDSLRKLISTGCEAIPGTSTINFDPIAKQQIFKAIDTANMQQKKDLIQDYKLLKYRLGRMPMMCDFLDASARDPYAYVSYSKSYFNLISEIEPEIKDTIEPEHKILLELFSQEIANAKRIDEVILFNELIKSETCSVAHLNTLLEQHFAYALSHETILSLERNLNFEFVKNPKRIVHLNDQQFILTKEFKDLLRNHHFAAFLTDALQYAQRKFSSLYDRKRLQHGFILGEKYSRKDVCRILNWDKDISSTLYGYRTQKKMTPCFVTYKKSDDISLGTQYNDHFIDPQTFAWESRSNRKIESPEIQQVIDSDLIMLFIKKSDGEGTDFYCLGQVSIVENSITQAYMPKSKEPVVHFKFKLKEAVEEKLYGYLVSE
jgi:superfamily II DNA or RNA helicase/HKD family nuclease